MKLAIQRLVRGDDGLTAIVYVDLQTLLPVTDLNGYRIVNSGDLYEEPVASVEDPETPSQNPNNSAANDPNASIPSRGENDGSLGPHAPNQNVSGPNAPSAPAVPTTPGTAAPAKPTTAQTVKSSVTAPASTPAAPTRAPSMGPLNGVRTAQGSILPGLDQSRFDKGLNEAFGGPQYSSMPGNQNPSNLERSLHSRNELENIKDDSLGIGRVTSSTKIAGRPETPAATGLPSARPSSMVATRPGTPAPTGLPGAQTQTAVNGVRPGVAGSLPAAPSPSGVAPTAGMSRAAVNAGITAQDGFATKPGNTISAQEASLPGVSRNAFDTQKKAEAITSGLATTVTSRPERVGSLPAAGIKTSPTLGVKDDWAGPVGTTQVHDSVFDRPSTVSMATKTKDDSIAKGAISTAKESNTAASRALGRTDVGRTVQNATPAQMANMGLVSRTAQEKSQIGHMIAGELAGSTLKGLTSTDAAKRALARQELADVVATVENRAQSQMFGSLAKALSPSQYNSLMTENLGVTNKNYAKYQKELDQAIADYYTGTLTPTNPEFTSYYNADVVSPTWGDEMANKQKVGYHTFGSLPEYAPAEAFESNRAKMTAQMDTRSQPVGFGKTAMSSPGFAVSGASRSTAGKTFGSQGSRAGSDIGRNDSAGPGRGSSSGGPSLSGGVGRASSASNSGRGSSGGSGNSGPGGSAGKSASGGVSGASRSTAGKGGASPSKSSGSVSGASRSTAGKTSSKSTGAGGSAGASQRSGGLF